MPIEGDSRRIARRFWRAEYTGERCERTHGELSHHNGNGRPRERVGNYFVRRRRRWWRVAALAEFGRRSAHRRRPAVDRKMGVIPGFFFFVFKTTNQTLRERTLIADRDRPWIVFNLLCISRRAITMRDLRSRFAFVIAKGKRTSRYTLYYVVQSYSIFRSVGFTCSRVVYVYKKKKKHFNGSNLLRYFEDYFINRKRR